MINKPDIVERKGPTPNGGDRALGVFLDIHGKAAKKVDAKYFIVKEFKGSKGICTITYRVKSDGKLMRMNKIFIK